MNFYTSKIFSMLRFFIRPARVCVMCYALQCDCCLRFCEIPTLSHSFIAQSRNSYFVQIDSYFAPRVYQLIYFPCTILEVSGTILESADKVGIPTLRRCNSGIAPIPTLRRTYITAHNFDFNIPVCTLPCKRI